MHWDEADGPTECVFVQNQDFKAYLWEAFMPTPAYADWLLQTDMSSAYAYERMVLQVLQSRAPGTWSLKMPSHAVHIETLLATYPDVRIVWAHRDPFKSTASFLRLNYLSRAATGADIDVDVTVANVLRQLNEHVDRPLAARRRIGDDRFFDLHYADLMRDPIAVMRSLYDWAGDDLTASTEQAMLDWLDAHPQDRHGVAPYSLDGSGVTRADLEPIFDEYLSVFDIELEEDDAMKAAMTTESHGFEVVDLPDPVPEPDQLVIRVAACGVCGSDIKAQPYAPAGMVMGHELGGEVVAVGSQADGWREGANVAVLPVVSCGSCRYCQAGLVSHCAAASYIGMGPAGGFAEYAAVPARHCFEIPAGVARGALGIGGAVRRRPARCAQRRDQRGRRCADRRRRRRRADHPDLGAAVGRRPRHRGRSRSAAAQLVQLDGCHRCTRVGRPRPRSEPTTPSSNASDAPSWCRPASRHCDRGAVS